MYPPIQITVSAEGPSLSPSQSSFKKPGLEKGSHHNGTATSDGSKKSVTWVKRVKIKRIRSHVLFSQEERNATWHTEEEYAAIKKGCIRTLRQMMSSDFQESNDFCPRGLEVRAKEASMARKEVRANACFAVLEEQEAQKQWGETDEERIREAYLSISQDAHYRAHFRGLGDERVVSKMSSSSKPSKKRR